MTTQTEIKHEITKVINSKSIIIVKFGIYDNCGNGYNHFEYNSILWTTDGDRDYGSQQEFKGKRYYFKNDMNTKEDVLKYFPELVSVYLLNKRDSFGVFTYPILNGKEWLQNSIDYAAKEYMVPLKDCKVIAKYNDSALTEWYLKRINASDHLKLVDKAIKEIEVLSGIKFNNLDKVSPTLYNDIHYTFVSNKEGWNVYKGNQNKIKKYPKF